MTSWPSLSFFLLLRICYYALDLAEYSTSQTLFDIGSDILKINLIHYWLILLENKMNSIQNANRFLLDSTNMKYILINNNRHNKKKLIIKLCYSMKM